MYITNDVKTMSTVNEPDCQVAPSSQVDHPNHYNQGSIECIAALDACGYGLDFCIGSAMKYLWRFKEKANPVQDLEKAAWYINYAVEKLKEGTYKA